MYLHYFTIQAEVISLFARQKKLPLFKISPTATFSQLGLDILDLVDLILEVEKNYALEIPDDLALLRVKDLVAFIHAKANIRQAS